MRMSPRRALMVLTGAAGVLGCGLVACGGTSGPGPAATADAYVRAWQVRNYPAMATLVDRPPTDFAATHRQVLDDLKVTSSHYRIGPATGRGSRRAVPLTSDLDVPGFGRLTLHTALDLRITGSRWKVEWTPSTLAPGLAAGDHLKAMSSVIWPARAPVLGAGGAVLTPSTQTVTVGVIGSRLKDPAMVASTLISVGLDANAVHQAISAAAANSGRFQTIAVIPQDLFAQIGPTIYPLPGTSFTTTAKFSTLTPDLAAHLVGSVGAITAEQLKALGPPYTPTSMVGRGGIEAAYEHQLAGAPSAAVLLIGPKGGTVSTLASHPPVPGRPVVTGIDPMVEKAAEAALGATSDPAAVVAIQPSTGQVLASVSHPTNSGFDLAFTGMVPPGSSFKIVTTDALLASGVKADASLNCPVTITEGGRTFKNVEGEVIGPEPFESAFARSCNTAFIGAASALTPSALPQAAARFGLGTPPQLGLPAYGGQVPTPTDASDQAASAIGQGRVEVSPLAMARVAATADSGVLRQPRLIVGSPDDTAPPQPMDPAIIATLHTFMAAVVATGTAAVAHLPAGVFGKTGTAEFGTANPPQTDAWFVGFRGDLAFAVLVYGGGVGGSVAAPIAGRLLAAIP